MKAEKGLGSEFWEGAVARADLAVEKYGHHDTVEFTLCRLVEEVGELVQAATSRSKERDVDRGPRILDEATDVVAMVIRLLREWPEGRISEPIFDIPTPTRVKKVDIVFIINGDNVPVDAAADTFLAVACTQALVKSNYHTAPEGFKWVVSDERGVVLPIDTKIENFHDGVRLWLHLRSTKQ